MAQLIFRIIYVKYLLAIDCVIFIAGYFLQWLFEEHRRVEVINYEKRNVDTIFYLTCLVLVSRILMNVGVLRDKKNLENESMRLDNERKRLENEEIELKNQLLKKQLSE